jgi:hypothetical protein
LREIAERTAVPHRLVQFWTDSRLLRPEGADEHPGRGTTREHPGRGRAREFSGVELQIASLLWPLAIAGGLPIGRLSAYASIFRGALTGAAPPQQRMAGGAILDNAELRRVLDRAVRGVGANFCIFSFATDGRSLVETLTDEKGPPKIDLAKFFGSEFPRGEALTVIISLERLATLFRPVNS